MVKIKCCFCKREIERKESNNALPLSSGRCCDGCNNNKVIPYRASENE